MQRYYFFLYTLKIGFNLNLEKKIAKTHLFHTIFHPITTFYLNTN